MSPQVNSRVARLIDVRYRFDLPGDSHLEPAWRLAEPRAGDRGALEFTADLVSLAVHPPDILWGVARTTSATEWV